jgi:sugar phosphate isomerase/epimerase
MTLAMSSNLTRRRFLQTAGLTSFGLAGLAALPVSARTEDLFTRTGPPRFKLSLAAYSFRDYFKDNHRPSDVQVDPARKIDMFQFVDFCAEHACDGAELTTYYFPANVSTDYLLKLRRHAFLRGITISGTAVGNTFTHPPGQQRNDQMTYVKEWIDRSAVLGTTHLRVFAGSAQGTSEAEAKKLCIAALEEAAAYAGQRGIILGLENHGGIVARPAALLEIIRAVNSPWLGINLDTGNFRTEDPYADLAACAPYTVNVQLKVELTRNRSKKPEPTDFPRVVEILRSVAYRGYIALEYEAESDPWQAVPKYLAHLKGLLV